MDITSSLMLQVSGSKLLFIYCIACVVDFSGKYNQSSGALTNIQICSMQKSIQYDIFIIYIYTCIFIYIDKILLNF